MGLFSRIFIAAVLIAAGPYYWFLIDATTGAVPETTIDIAAVRRLADEMPGPKPTSVEYAPLAVRRMPGTLLVAGGGLRAQTVAKIAFRLETPGGDTLIDVGPTRPQAADVGFKNFDERARLVVDRWMKHARRIVFTHEHPDFVGAFIASDAIGSLGPKVIVSERQADVMDRMRPGVRESVARIVPSSRPAAIAPGIVTIPAPGHSPGSQFVYVRLTDGREYLFVGDTASMQRNVTWLRPRSRLASSWQGGEDRAAVEGHLKGLAALALRVPRLKIVYGADLMWLQDARHGPGFSSAFRYDSHDGDPQTDLSAEDSGSSDLN